ncbi:MAG: ribosome biogenesis GTPase Der [Proteobacteria bacterium]|nr:ribosome biogenesis GTPase Der [Pseudomonadota bacterium]MDA1132845.1 ribosome biogenesis GTPase Der [Pseudomonadota bacterium]
MALTVAILGRPNVGKSTLFNRLTGRRSALVDPTPGVTRDRREGRGSLGGLEFDLIDTAGYEEGEAGSLVDRMWRQTETALRDADVALLLVDARAGLTPTDEDFARRVRAANVDVILVANKCEGRAADAGFYEAFGLGLGEPVAISAEHGLGLADLYEALAARDAARQSVNADEIVDRFEGGDDADAADAANAADAAETESTLRLAIVGRPNVGKSTLINRLIGEERLITGPEPGLTRDAIAVEWEFAGRHVQLMDTAGLRRKAKVAGRLEQMSAADTRRAISRANVVVLVLDATEQMARADLSTANLALEEGRALVVALNKWDQVTDGAAVRLALAERLGISLPQVQGVPVVTFSALSGAGVATLMPAVVKAHDLWSTRIGTGALNRWLAEAVERHPPPSTQGRENRMRYVTQAGVRPPTFVAFASRPKAIPASWVRFAVNDLRQAFDLPGVPIRLHVRKSGDGRRRPGAYWIKPNT